VPCSPRAPAHRLAPTRRRSSAGQSACLVSRGSGVRISASASRGSRRFACNRRGTEQDVGETSGDIFRPRDARRRLRGARGAVFGRAAVRPAEATCPTTTWNDARRADRPSDHPAPSDDPPRARGEGHADPTAQPGLRRCDGGAHEPGRARARPGRPAVTARRPQRRRPGSSDGLADVAPRRSGSSMQSSAAIL
jgi:hypothetical protein